MNDNIDAIIFRATNEIAIAPSKTALDRVRSEYIDGNGILNRSVKSAEQLPEPAKVVRLRVIEQAKRKLNIAINKRLKELK